MVCYSRPTVYAYVPNVVSIGLFCRPLTAKIPQFLPIFAIFWTSAFSVVAKWQQSDKVEYGCTTTNLPLPSGIKIVSVLQRLHGEIGRTISDVQKGDGQTDKQTDKQKTQRFCPPPQRVKSELHQTWHGDRGSRACSCIPKSFWGLTRSFAARGAENLGETRPPQLKTPITP